MEAKALGDGVLLEVEGVLYTCPSGKRAVVRALSFVNSDAAERSFNVWVKRGGVQVLVSPKDTLIGVGYKITTDEGHVLEAGDELLGAADAGGVVQWSLSGEEESV